MREDLKKTIEDNWEDIKAWVIEKVEAEQKPKSIWDLNIRDGEQYYVLRTTGDINIDYFSSRLDEYITRGLYPQYIDWSGNTKDGWELIFECF